MERGKWYKSLLFKLIVSIAIGIVMGTISNEGFIQVLGSIKTLLGQMIGYIVPLIILGFITPAIIV